MGIKRLLIDSRIHDGWTVWYGHTKTGPDRRRDKEEGAWPMAAGSGTPACSSMCSGLRTVAAVSALGGHSSDSMGGPSTPLM